MQEEEGPDEEAPAFPKRPQKVPVPCMRCRRPQWVELGRTYVVCEDCQSSDAED